MKKISLGFFLLLVFLNNAYCQTEKGSKMIGGSGYAHLSDVFYLQLSPSFGHFFFHNFAVGAEANFSYNEYGPTTLAIGPYLRYYIGSGANRAFLTGIFAYGNYSNKEDYYDYSIRNSFSAGVGAGYTRLLSQQFGLEAILNYQNTNIQGRYSYDRLFASLGIQVYLPSNKNR